MSEEVTEVVGTGPPLRVILGLLGALLLIGIIIIAVMSSESAPPSPPPGAPPVESPPKSSTVAVTAAPNASMTTPGVILSSASGLPNTVIATGDVYKAMVHTLAKQRKYKTEMGGSLEFFGLTPAAATPDALPASGRISIAGPAANPVFPTNLLFAGQYVWSGSADKKTLVITNAARTRTIATFKLMGGRFILESNSPSFSVLLTPA
jgi:hypothetical protein